MKVVVLKKTIFYDSPIKDKMIKEFIKVHDRGIFLKISYVTLNWLGIINVPSIDKCFTKEMGTEEEGESEEDFVVEALIVKDQSQVKGWEGCLNICVPVDISNMVLYWISIGCTLTIYVILNSEDSYYFFALAKLWQKRGVMELISWWVGITQIFCYLCCCFYLLW